MGHWVTLDDDQHVYISDGGKVLATRSKISSAGGAKERGKALAARSKAAITRNAFSAVRARSFFKSGEEKARLKSEISQHLAKREHHEAAVKSKQLTELEKQSPSTTRAIEHAKAAGPSLREQADKARAAKDRTGIEPRFRANMAKDIRKIRAGNAELAAGINNPPAGTSRQEMIDRVTEKAKAFMKTSKLKAETPVGRGGGDDIKYRAMARTIKRALRIARSQ